MSESGGTVYDGPNINDEVVGVDYDNPASQPKKAETTTQSGGVYDPSEHTVEEVQAYLAAHPDQTDAVLAAEQTGKARTTLLGSSQEEA